MAELETIKIALPAIGAIWAAMLAVAWFGWALRPHPGADEG
jgi:uncharacterized protein (DUF697 family)